MKRTPYIEWTRDELWNHLRRQCLEYGISREEVKEMVYDTKWDPLTDFDGCSVVQDERHPFLPCFIHDYRCVIGGNKLEYHKEFRDNLIKAKFSNFKANKYYYGVVVGCGMMYLMKNILR